MIGAHDLPYIYPEQLSALFNAPLIWSPKNHDAFGVYTISTLWNWPLEVIYGFFGKVGIPYDLAIFLLGVVPFVVLGGIGASKILNQYKIRGLEKYISIIFFLINPFSLLLIDGGQLNLAVAYACLPLTFILRKSVKKLLVILTVISIFDLRILYIACIVLGLRLVMFNEERKILIKNLLIAGVFLIGFHAFWIVPSIFAKPPTLPASYDRPSQVYSLSFASFAHALTFYQPHWPKNIFGQITNVPVGLYIIPIIILYALFLTQKNKEVSYWGFLAFIGVFLSKGTNTPFQEIYIYMFSYLPGFSLFRDPIKFYMLIGLSYLVLLAISLSFIKNKKIILTTLCIIYFTFLSQPFIFKQFTGLFSQPRSEKNYKDIALYLRNSPPGKILWIPSKPPIGYSDPNHESTDALTLLNHRAFLSGVVGDYELLNFIRDSSESGKLITELGIKYIAFSALDPSRDSLKKEDVAYHSNFTNQIASLPWIESRMNFGDVTLLITKSDSNMFSMKKNIVAVLGSQNVLKNYTSLSDSAVILTEQYPEILTNIYDLPNIKIIANVRNTLDMVGASLPQKYFYPLISQLPFSPKSTGWWKKESTDLISLRHFLQEKYSIDNIDPDYGQGYAISEGVNEIHLVIPKCSDCMLAMRAMNSNKAGNIKVSANNQILEIVNTKIDTLKNIVLTHLQTPGEPMVQYEYNSSAFKWSAINLPLNANQITLTTSGDVNIVNALVLIPKKEFEKIAHKVQDLKVTDIQENSIASTESPKVVSTKINNTKYKVVISGVNKTSVLTFNQNYDAGWELSGKKPLPVYDLINGYVIDHDGEYVLEYVSQKYVYMGLVISFASIVLVLIIIYNRKYVKKI